MVQPGETDYLYHLGLDTTYPLRDMFGDVKFVCMGGSAVRMERLANSIAQELNIPIPTGMGLAPIGKTERYSMFKVGPVICVNHGMGQPSLSILMHELYKMLNYAGAEDVTYFRIGTCGGVGVAPGTVVLTTEALNGFLEPCIEMAILGQRVRRPTTLKEDLIEEIREVSGDIAVVAGKTIGADCFYEGQGRLDGAICEYTAEDKMAFLRQAEGKGVKNIEMEAPYFAAFCHKLNVRGAIMCSVLVNRLNGDQIQSTPEELASFSSNSSRLAIKFIQHKLRKCARN
eukprot:gnl/Trimastix_PCT/1128.p2 GENE.gnl/Trimastix_PCT/1128~~gnl/Trimastix_PCT/1128.p2  ORF type:complete len:286 (+),score=88.37 gnl/Trimastix_PCT/1128:51-908(+)